MKKLSKKDIVYAIVTGVTAGILAWLILQHLGKPTSVWLIVIIPVLWILGVQLGYFLGRWIGFFDQFGKFAAIGFTNFAVDAGVLNLLIAFSGIAGGAWYSVFKGISFCVAVVHSYFWNRRWTFTSKSAVGSEAPKFFLVMILSLLVNVGVASLIVHVLPSSVGNANIGAIIGSAAALIFSFVGFKLVVFK